MYGVHLQTGWRQWWETDTGQRASTVPAFCVPTTRTFDTILRAWNTRGAQSGQISVVV